MNIIIKAGALGLKRVINGGFAIAGNRQDIERVRYMLDAALEDEKWSYGWVDIHDRLPSVPNSLPIPWDEQ